MSRLNFCSPRPATAYGSMMGIGRHVTVLCAFQVAVTGSSVVGLIGFWVFGPEPKGLTFDEIDRALDGPALTARPGAQTAGN